MLWILLCILGSDADRQLLGRNLHSPATPPRCKSPNEDHLLWVDWSLRAPGQVQLLGVQISSTQESLDRISVVQLQQHGDVLKLKEIHKVALHEESDAHDGHKGLVGQNILYGSINLAMNGDTDLLGVIYPCKGSSPLAATGDSSGKQSLVFMLQDLQQGYQVHLSQAEEAQPLAWVFYFNVLEGPSTGPTPRSGGVLQFLVKVLQEAKCYNEDTFTKNLRTLSACPWVHRYPTYILHTGKMEGANDEQMLTWMDGLRSAVGMDLRFLDVSEDFERVELGDSKVKLDEHDMLWLDSTLSNSPQIRKQKPRRHQAGYRHMCRFQSSTVLHLPAFQYTRYLLHLDSDATFNCRGSSSLDPFEEMARGDHVYGLFEVGLEDPGCTKGWSSFLKEWVLLNDVGLPNPVAALSTAGKNISRADHFAAPETIVEVPLDSLSLTWGTAWEVLDLNFFASSSVLHFTKRVEGTLGHYRHLWGDHLVRAYQVLLHAPLELVRCFDSSEIHGSHGCSPENQFDMAAADGDEWKYLYQVLDDISCPDLWVSGLKGIPWLGGPGSGTSPDACLKLCNKQPGCQGFDFVYRDSSQTADCVTRSGIALKQECNVGEDAIKPWLEVTSDIDLVTKVGATNRFQIIETLVERQMNCSEWREEIAEKVRKADASLSLQDLP